MPVCQSSPRRRCASNCATSSSGRRSAGAWPLATPARSAAPRACAFRTPRLGLSQSGTCTRSRRRTRRRSRALAQVRHRNRRALPDADPPPAGVRHTLGTGSCLPGGRVQRRPGALTPDVPRALRCSGRPRRRAAASRGIRPPASRARRRVAGLSAGRSTESSRRPRDVIDPLVVAFGFGVGSLIGLTGIGGGSLMTTLLVLVVGVQPVVAISTDLAYGAITKTVGGWRDLRSGTGDRGTRCALPNFPHRLKPDN